MCELRFQICVSMAAGANVDIKKSSYKKLSKLLSTFEKKVGEITPPLHVPNIA